MTANGTGPDPVRTPSLLGVLLADAASHTGAAQALAVSSRALDAGITGVSTDSRRIAPGDLFIAIPGTRFDGSEFLGAAQRAGASVALVQRPGGPPGLRWVQVKDTRRAAGPVAAAFHKHPSRGMRLVGVTGTNGKTTVAWLLDALFFDRFGASLFAGTVGHRARTPGGELRAPGPALTSREAPDFQALLAAASEAGCASGAVECSSHGLALGRLDGTSFAAGVFTNLTRDHLDFHRDFEDYFAAKRRLFTELVREEGIAVASADGSHGQRLAGELERDRPDLRLVRFGSEAGADVRIASVRSGLDGLRVRLASGGAVHEIRSPLIGAFHAQNLTAAWAAATALGVPPEAAAAGLGAAPPPPGRMERITGSEAPSEAPAVFVDYAHTPDALAHALSAARSLVGAGRLTVVFGAGGDRDREKRPLMGDAAARLADRVVLTSDNPRDEDPAAIVAQIRLGADNPLLAAVVEEEPDRAAAIRGAVAGAASGDLVLIAGRGHETIQEVRGERVPLDDRALAAAALADWGAA